MINSFQGFTEFPEFHSAGMRLFSCRYGNSRTAYFSPPIGSRICLLTVTSEGSGDEDNTANNSVTKRIAATMPPAIHANAF